MMTAFQLDQAARRRNPVALRPALPLAMIVLLCIGCHDEAPSQKSAPQPAAAPAQSAVQRVPLSVIDRSGLDALLVFHPGKVVLIDFWATDCERCRELFPPTVALSRTLADKGLVVLSVACDDAAHADAALAFVQKSGATFQNLRSVHGANDLTFSDFKIESRALPHYKLYDRKGKRRQTLSDNDEEPLTAEILRRAVQNLLDEPPPEN